MRISFIAHYAFRQVPVLTGNSERFAALVVLLLPILLISDSLELKLADLKEHGLSLLYLSVVAVTLSIIMALLLSEWLFADYALSAAAIISLFAMVLATDPVSVVSIFSKFELPHQLKILAEGESLFNDATALIAFVFIGLYALSGKEITTGHVIEISSIVVLGSIAVGVAAGFIGLAAMKTTKKPHRGNDGAHPDRLWRFRAGRTFLHAAQYTGRAFPLAPLRHFVLHLRHDHRQPRHDAGH